MVPVAALVDAASLAQAGALLSRRGHRRRGGDCLHPFRGPFGGHDFEYRSFDRTWQRASTNLLRAVDSGLTFTVTANAAACARRYWPSATGCWGFGARCARCSRTLASSAAGSTRSPMFLPHCRSRRTPARRRRSPRSGTPRTNATPWTRSRSSRQHRSWRFSQCI